MSCRLRFDRVFVESIFAFVWLRNLGAIVYDNFNNLVYVKMMGTKLLIQKCFVSLTEY